MKKILLTCSLIACLFMANAQTYLTEDFESGTLPTGWSQATLATDGGWKFGTSTALSSASFVVPAHTKIACTNDDACNCNKSNDLFQTPLVDLTTAVNPYLQFDCFYYNGTYQGATEIATVVGSIDGGVTWTDIQTVTGAAGWNSVNISLVSLIGHSNAMVGFRYNDSGGWLFGWGIDNVSIFEPAAYDANFSSITPSTGSSAAYSVVSGNLTLGGTITNNGANPITGFTVKYSDGTNVYSDTKSGLNINSFQTYQFAHNTPYLVPSLGAHNLTMWVELTGDANQANDTLGTTINGVAFLPTHKVVFEEGTGTWCGWCVRGIVFMDSMASVHPNDAILIAVHNADPMVYTPYDAGVGTLISGYPSVLADRGTVIDPQDLFTSYNERIGNFGFADITPTCNYNYITDTASVAVDAHFATDLSGDYRLAVVFTEDAMHGTASAWGQHNYYSGGGNGPMGGFENMPAIIPAAQMYYDHVARTILGGFNGTSGSLPASLVSGSTYSYTFKYKVPVGSVLSNMHCYALLIDVTNNQILNGNSAPIILGVEEVAAGVSGLSLYPNPSSDFINLDLNLNKSQNVSITITDVLGNAVASIESSHLNNGNHNFHFDISAFSAGVYNLNINSDSGIVSRKFVK